MGLGDKFDAAKDKVADVKAHLHEDADKRHSDDTEGGGAIRE
jgi:hypothetical protein